MPTRPIRHLSRKQQTQKQGNDRRRGIMICASLSVFLALTILGASYAARLPDKHADYATFLAQSSALRSSPILFVPVEGNVCRKRLIDNKTWKIKDGGTVVCDEAVSWNTSAPNQKYFVAVRVDAIRAGFRAPVP